ncbi:U4/U6.U5 tri-snRNP-associated protein 2 [Galdieria sulphuraria]|nr:U4/U6.U5 tri-snRNP-associated protein 2 [Galdieria sulphuraria]
MQKEESSTVSKNIRSGRECPYMDTIDRTVLDFDYEKLCCVTLERHNVYACLVCGKYFQGRGPKTPAFAHAIEYDHHLFIHLETEKVYCLPENYQVVDPTLEDIKAVLNPRLDKAQVEELDKRIVKFRTLEGKIRYQGVLGMSNLQATDYINVILQALVRIKPLRDFFLLYQMDKQDTIEHPLIASFGEFMRKFWNPRPFRSQISPHELVQEIVKRSKKRFPILQQGNPVEFLAWFLHSLQDDLMRAGQKPLMKNTFEGQMEIETFQANEKSSQQLIKKDHKLSQFLFLSLELPPMPLFKDSLERNMIPQVSLASLLSRFVQQELHHDVQTGHSYRYRLRRLPYCLILVMKRFVKSNFVWEKNISIVHFPIRDLDMTEYLSMSCPGIESNGVVYDLTAVVIHDDSWFEIQDLQVKEAIPQLVSLSEAYILFYEKK